MELAVLSPPLISPTISFPNHNDANAAWLLWEAFHQLILELNPIVPEPRREPEYGARFVELRHEVFGTLLMSLHSYDPDKPLDPVVVELLRPFDRRPCYHTFTFRPGVWTVEVMDFATKALVDWPHETWPAAAHKILKDLLLLLSYSSKWQAATTKRIVPKLWT